jgi:4-amino-4-deoxy-L-arabinose transferase and related glycosyltransferases of PMT family
MNLSIAPLQSLSGLNLRAWILAILFALLSLVLDTRDNTFPSSYHPDEPSKARQVIEGEFNFHHPMLLLTTTRTIVAMTGAPLDEQSVTIAGRTASAAFTAAAIACLVLLACLHAGLLSGAAAGALLVANHQLFELAHYFKEDPAVLLGVSATFLAITLYDRGPTALRAAWLGVATGLAVSGKYVGAVMIPLAAVIILVRADRKWIHSAIFVACAAALFSAVNLPVLTNPEGFAAGFEREIGFAVSGHKGITRDIPHGVYGAVFRTATNPVVWILLGIYASGLAFRAKTARLSEWMLALFPPAFALMLSFSPKTHHRYFLPATGLLLTLAAIGVVTPALVRWRDKGLARSVTCGISAILIAATLAVQTPKFLTYFRGFRHDGRAAMAAYLREHARPGTVIVQDKRADLDSQKLPFEFRGKLFAADEGTLDELRASGVEFVAVAEGDYGRFFRKDFKSTDDGAADYARRRAFYEQLFAEGELVFQSEAGTLQYLQPSVKLYRLSPSADSSGNP